MIDIPLHGHGGDATSPCFALRGNRGAELLVFSPMQPKEPHDEPSSVSADEGEVVVDGPDGVAVSLTPDAAVETSHRLLDAGLIAAGQKRLARGEEREEPDAGEPQKSD